MGFLTPFRKAAVLREQLVGREGNRGSLWGDCNTSAEWHHWPFLRKQQSSFIIRLLRLLDSRLCGSDTLDSRLRGSDTTPYKPSQEKTSGVLHSAEVMRGIRIAGWGAVLLPAHGA